MSSYLEMFYKKGVLQNFAKFTGRQLCKSLFFKNIVDSRTPIKKVTPSQVFPCEFFKVFANTILVEQLGTAASEN